jgi:threonine dehydrogenase-like Zn-dependent dehydrogenase
LGADRIIDYHAPGPDWPPAAAFPTVIEASGSTAAMTTALTIAAREAKVLVLGDYGQSRADFPWNSLLHKELKLIGSNASAGAWPDAVKLATSGDLPLAKLVSHRFPAAAFADGIALVRYSRDVVKVVLDWSAS